MKIKYNVLVAALTVICCIFLFPCISSSASEEEEEVIVVAIDAGHSGSDSGAVGRYDGKLVTERETNLKIAEAMKKELDTYKGVKAVLTRTDNETEWSISSRVAKSIEYDADIMISLHNNANGDAAAYSGGACVIVSAGQYRPELAKMESGLGNIILNELNKKIGAKNQGLLIRRASYTKYPNGENADFYQLTREPVENGMASIIVEHCFIDNYNDYQKCLSTDAKIARLGRADATAVAKYFGLTKKNGKVSYKAKGRTVRYINDNWLVKGGRYYYIKSNGEYAAGWKKINGRLYMFKKNGQGRQGFYIEKSGSRKGTYYFRKNGRAVTGWTRINGNKYYFDKNGRAAFGLTKIKKEGVRYTYYFGKRGRMLTGWHKINKRWYYFSKRSGKLLKVVKTR